MKKIRVHAVVTANDGSTGSTSTTFTSKFKKKTLLDLVNNLKIIFKKAGIQILFDPQTDLTEVESALLNEDSPFKNGQIVLPPASVDDLTGNKNVVAQREFAQNIRGSAVIYFRDFDKTSYSYINSSGETVRDNPVNFSGSKHLYVRYAKGGEDDRLAHELGHYFHLAHTFANNKDFKKLSDAAAKIKWAVEVKNYSKADGALIFDGDRGNVKDTPPDPGGVIMGLVNVGGDACGSVDTANIMVSFSDGGSQSYALQPDRQNLMSYYFKCMDTNTAHFSNEQINVINKVIETENRKHLLEELPGIITGVFEANKQEELYVFGWEYKYFRMKYDYIWKEGWRLHEMENLVVNDKVLYWAVFRKTAQAEKQLYGYSYEDFRATYDKLWGEGWRLRILNNYFVKGSLKYTAVFEKNSAAEKQLYGWSYDDYRKEYDLLWQDGWRLHLLNNYIENEKLKYTAVFRMGATAERQLYNYKFEDFRNEYDSLWNKGWRLHILNNFWVGGKVHVTAVFRTSKAGEIQFYNWTHLAFREKLQEQYEKGLRIKILNAY